MNFFCALAKKTVETYAKEGRVINSPQKLPTEAQKKAGVFVTLFKDNQLRGCVGTFLPTKDNIAQEIISNAIKAAFEDPRFPTVDQKELAKLNYEVSVLQTPVPVENTEELNPHKYGILVNSTSGKSALLLPNLENLDTKEKQLNACLQKAGIDPQKEEIQIFKFETQKYEGSSSL